MANISLDGFLNAKEDKSLSDLDWLDVNMSEYNNLPFDDTPEYISVPKLEQAWTHEETSNSFGLVPNNMSLQRSLPTINTMASEELSDVEKLLNYTKTQMMSGKKGSELRDLLQERASTQIIKSAFNHLKKLSSEQGLLGNVYIDPTVFAKCEDGAEFVRKRAKTAKYVVSMDKCSGCIFNREGRCEVYKKHLASEVIYNQDLFDFYSKHFANISGKEVKIASKEDLRNAFTIEKKVEVKIAENKPSLKEEEKDEKTLEKKEEEYQNTLNDLQKAMGEVTGNKVAKDIAWLLIKGYSSDIVKSHLKSKYTAAQIEENRSVISSVLEKQGSLGKVYIDTSLLSANVCDKKIAKEFFDKNARNVHYILANCNCTNCGCKTISSKKVVKSLDDIPREAWDASFNSYSLEIKNKLSSIYNTNKGQGLRLAYLQEGISNTSLKTYKEVETFGLTKNVDASEYTPSVKNEVYFTPKKISAALEKGFTLSKIIKTGKSLGVTEVDMKANIIKAFDNHVSSINKYQVDIALDIPKNVKVKMSGKDISIDLNNPTTEMHTIAHDSTNAPLDTLVSDMDLKEASFDSSITDSAYEDIEISGLNHFDMG